MAEPNFKKTDLQFKPAASDELKVTEEAGTSQTEVHAANLGVSNSRASGSVTPQGIRSRWVNPTPVKPAVDTPSIYGKKGTAGRKAFIIALIIMAPILAVTSAVFSDPRFSRVLQDRKQAGVLCRVLGHLVQPRHQGVATWFYKESYIVDPTDVTGLVDLALMKQNNGDLAGAKADYERLIKIAPNARMYNNVSNIYQHEGRIDDAMDGYTRSTQLDPNWSFAWYNRGDLYFQKGKYDLALADYNRAIRTNYATTYFRRAELYKAMGKPDLAQRDLDIIARRGYKNVMFCFATIPPDEY